MKSTVVDESLSSNKTNVLFQRILQDFKINSTVWETYIKFFFIIFSIGISIFDCLVEDLIATKEHIWGHEA